MGPDYDSYDSGWTNYLTVAPNLSKSKWILKSKPSSSTRHPKPSIKCRVLDVYHIPYIIWFISKTEFLSELMLSDIKLPKIQKIAVSVIIMHKNSIYSLFYMEPKIANKNRLKKIGCIDNLWQIDNLAHR